MNRIFVYVILLASLVSCNSCEPIGPPAPPHPDPVFSVHFTLNGMEKTYIVGRDSLSLKPGFELGKHRTPVYLSTLFYEDCPTDQCEHITFRFNGDKPYDKNNYDFETSFHRAKWDYQWKYENKLFRLGIVSDRASRGFIKERWLVNNKPTLRDWQKVDPPRKRIFSYDLTQIDDITLCREVMSTKFTGVFSSCKKYALKSFKRGDSLRVSIRVGEVKGNTIVLKAIVKGATDDRSLKYTWQNVSGIDNMPKILIKNEDLLNKRISVSVVDPNTHKNAFAVLQIREKILQKSVRELPQFSSYYLASVSRKINPDLIQLGRVSLLYTNKDGEVFSSSAFKQPPESYFNVLKISDYSEKNKQYKKLEVEYSVVLFGRKEDLKITKAKAIIAIGLP